MWRHSIYSVHCLFLQRYLSFVRLSLYLIFSSNGWVQSIYKLRTLVLLSTGPFSKCERSISDTGIEFGWEPSFFDVISESQLAHTYLQQIKLNMESYSYFSQIAPDLLYCLFHNASFLLSCFTCSIRHPDKHTLYLATLSWTWRLLLDNHIISL